MKAKSLNQIKPLTNVLFNIVFFIAAAISILPVIFVFMISITSEKSLNDFGYRFIPMEFSLTAYAFLWKEKQIILNAFWISVLVTVVGVIIGLVPGS